MTYIQTYSNTSGLARCLAIANGKGGVFKTSIAANLSALAAAAGWSVLLVDLDPQANLTEDLGLADITDAGRALVQAIQFGEAVKPLNAGRRGLDILCGGQYVDDLASLVVARRQAQPEAWAYLLADALSPVSDDYDLIVIDCPPGDSALQALALTAARHVIIPTRSDAASRKGLRRIASQFELVRKFNPLVHLLAVVRTGTSSTSTAIAAATRRELETDLGGAAPVTQTSIRHAEAAAKRSRDTGTLPHELEPQLHAQAPFWQRLREGQPTTGMIPQSVNGLAQDYLALTQEILDLISAYEQQDTSAGEDR